MGEQGGCLQVLDQTVDRSGNVEVSGVCLT